MGILLIPFILAISTGVATIFGMQPVLQEEQLYLQECEAQNNGCSIPQWHTMSYLPTIGVFFATMAVMHKHEKKPKQV